MVELKRRKECLMCGRSSDPHAVSPSDPTAIARLAYCLHLSNTGHNPDGYGDLKCADVGCPGVDVGCIKAAKRYLSVAAFGFQRDISAADLVTRIALEAGLDD